MLQCGGNRLSNDGVMNRINFYFTSLSAKSVFGLILAALARVVSPYAGQRDRYRRRFEKETGRVIGCDQTLAFSSNRGGIFSLLKALDIGDGDEVLLTGYTCSAVAEPVLHCGARPVYVDIRPVDFCLSPSLLEKAVTAKTRVIILQHTYGFSGPVDEVLEFAKRHDLFVIEDSALAFGSRQGSKWLGTFGDAAVWSFELSKTISVGWGGLVAINGNVPLARKVWQIRDDAGYQGRWLAAQRLFQGGASGLLYHHRVPHLIRRYLLAFLFKSGIFRSSAKTPASDLRMPADQQWKHLSGQFSRLEAISANSGRARGAYDRVLASHGCSPNWSSRCTPETVLIRYPLLVADAARFVRFFASRDIEAGRWFSEPVSCDGTPSTAYGYVPGSCPVAEWVCSHIVNLPLHGRMTTDLIDLVASTLDVYLHEHPDEVDFLKSAPPTPEFCFNAEETK
jgi:perosamine synthetase